LKPKKKAWKCLKTKAKKILEDRVVDLEDKLDELMAEFEALMGDEGDRRSWRRNGR
jgi:hypothetical protein